MKAETTLRHVLAERGWAADELALVSGCGPSTARRILTGKTRPRPGTVIAMARGLGFPVGRMRTILDATWDAAHPEMAHADEPGG
jgi:transcriptional regulator with XRE-family HTH domain